MSGDVGGMFIVRTVVVYREVLLLRSPLQTNLPPVLWEVSERRKGGGETESAEVAPIGCTGDGCVCLQLVFVRSEPKERQEGTA